MLVSQNTNLVRGCVFAFWFLTMLSLNGLKFTVLFTPLVCCSECSWMFMITRLYWPSSTCVWCCITITSILTSQRWIVEFAVETQKGGTMLLLLPDEMGKGWCKVRTWHQRCCIRCVWVWGTDQSLKKCLEAESLYFPDEIQHEHSKRCFGCNGINKRSN